MLSGNPVYTNVMLWNHCSFLPVDVSAHTEGDENEKPNYVVVESRPLEALVVCPWLVVLAYQPVAFELVHM